MVLRLWAAAVSKAFDRPCVQVLNFGGPGIWASGGRLGIILIPPGHSHGHLFFPWRSLGVSEAPLGGLQSRVVANQRLVDRLTAWEAAEEPARGKELEEDDQ